MILASRCMAEDREFANIWHICVWCCDLLLSFGFLSTSFSFPWAVFGDPLGSFRQAFDHFGAPCLAMEVALVGLGSYTRIFYKKWSSISEEMALKYNACPNAKMARRNCSADPPIPWIRRIRLKCALARSSQPPFTRVGD